MNNTNFDSIAPIYDSLSRLVFGDALHRAQCRYLQAIPDQAEVLLVGGGSGRLLEELLKLKPRTTVTYLEASSEMLRLSRQHISARPALPQNAVHFLQGTEADLPASYACHAVLTPFLLDLFPDERLVCLMDRLYGALLPGGLWLFSDFWPVRNPAPLWQRLLLRSMYTFFGAVSQVRAARLPDFGKHFARYSLRQQHTVPFYGGMVQAKVYRKV